jgi:hypothetical protein
MARGLSVFILIFFSHMAFAQQILFDTNVSVQKTGQTNFDELKTGAKVKLKRGETLLAVPKQGIPLLIVSAMNSDTQINVTNANFSSVIVETLQSELEKSSNEIVDALRRSDQFIQKRDYSQASQIMGPLKDKYPRVSAIFFMNATIHYLMNDKDLAGRDLERGLQIDPHNEDAKNLLAKIRGNP